MLVYGVGSRNTSASAGILLAGLLPNWGNWPIQPGHLQVEFRRCGYGYIPGHVGSHIATWESLVALPYCGGAE